MRHYEKKITLFNEKTPFSTNDHVLSIGVHHKSTIRAIIKSRIIQISYPAFADVNDLRIQQVIRKAIAAALKMEAVKYLPDLTNALASKYGFRYTLVSFRNNKTRWGSCSRDNRINLNIHLMRLPSQLREYIILHELCHTVHKHHQKAFWQLLDQVTEKKARELDKKLNTFSPEIY